MTTGIGPTSLLIGGELRNAADGGRFDVLDPATEEDVASVASATPDDAQRAVDAAAEALPDWSARPPRDHADVLPSASAWAPCGSVRRATRRPSSDR
ncbi:aldehyde dehydrogenase family protein [Pseudonocardia sp. GCM10023141]|uniref:aldehyde dehydrogenase family protein n=1 Tax=Pseudonocardia sp. GCM10023141 TaxID=3252653 RepID=UPI00361B9C46